MKKFTFIALFIFALAFAFTLAPAAEAAPPGPSIVDVAVAANGEGGPYEGQFDILISIVAADQVLLNTLNGNGQFTVFAPTDAAFEALAVELGVELGAIPAETLRDVVLYHVARGNREAADVTSSERIRTMNGGFLFVDGTVLTDQNDRDANIIVADITAPANGVIHAIDRVVLP